jgi:hypothetical protein
MQIGPANPAGAYAHKQLIGSWRRDRDLGQLQWPLINGARFIQDARFHLL